MYIEVIFLKYKCCYDISFVINFEVVIGANVAVSASKYPSFSQLVNKIKTQAPREANALRKSYLRAPKKICGGRILALCPQWQ